MNYDLDRPVRLVSGTGDITQRTGCWMSLGNLIVTGEWMGDDAPCVDPVIRELCIRANDRCASDEERAEWIGPRLLDPFGTDVGPEATRDRAYLAVDRAVRVWAPLVLDAAGYTDHAATLRELVPITDEDSARASHAATYASHTSHAASYAAHAASHAAKITGRDWKPLVFGLIDDLIRLHDRRPYEPAIACDVQELIAL